MTTPVFKPLDICLFHLWLENTHLIYKYLFRSQYSDSLSQLCDIVYCTDGYLREALQWQWHWILLTVMPNVCHSFLQQSSERDHIHFISDKTISVTSSLSSWCTMKGASLFYLLTNPQHHAAWHHTTLLSPRDLVICNSETSHTLFHLLQTVISSLCILCWTDWQYLQMAGKFCN